MMYTSSNIVKNKFFWLISFILLIFFINKLFIKKFYKIPTFKKIMFIVHTESMGGKGVYSLYKEMKKVGHSVKIVALPWIYTKDLLSDIDYEFTKKFASEDIIYPCGKQAPYTHCTSLDEFGTFDYIFTQNPYQNYLFKDSILDPFFLTSSLKKITKKIMFIVYGPHLFHQDTINDPNLKHEVDTVFVDSESTKRIYIERYKFSPNKVVVSGYQTYKEVRDALGSLKKKRKHEKILWLPRWTLSFKDRDLYEGGSTFLNYYHFFYEFAKCNPNIELTIRPHQLLFSHAVKGNFISHKDLDFIFKRFQKFDNVTISMHKNKPIVEDVINADIIISDGTSALGEVIVADKPIIYLSNGWNNEFNSNTLSKELKKYVYLAYEPNDILTHLKYLRDNNYKSLISTQPRGLKENIKALIKLAKCRILDHSCDILDFKKLLDPVENPAKNIAEYLLYDPI